MKVETSTRTAFAVGLALALLLLVRGLQAWHERAPTSVAPEAELPSIAHTRSILDNLQIEVERTGQRIDSVGVRLWELSETSQLCAGLRDVVAQSWGRPTDSSTEPGEQTWRLPGRTLSITAKEPSGCAVRLRRTAWANDWFETVMHVETIGAPLAELEAKIADLNPRVELQRLEWTDTGLDGQPLQLMATVLRGRVVGVSAMMEQDPGRSTWRSVLARYGAYDTAIQHEGVSVWTWRRAQVVVRDDASDAPWAQRRHPKEPIVDGITVVEIGRTP